jgi:formyltetrahydrofolate hydrolase
MSEPYVVTLSGPDRVGIVHAVTSLLVEHNANITEAAQFNDVSTGLFFMRVRFEVQAAVSTLLREAFTALASQYNSGRAINIHHSFLPSFKGARPDQQAFDRGVKLIGATVHYLTGDLDEGPIIEQDIARADHSMSPAQLAAIGRDTEPAVLARAMVWHVERRVLLNGHKTVVFR